jgi:hypothetical protein
VTPSVAPFSVNQHLPSLLKQTKVKNIQTPPRDKPPPLTLCSAFDTKHAFKLTTNNHIASSELTSSELTSSELTSSAAMCALRLPENALRLFEQEWPNVTGPSKWLIYSLNSAPQEANEFYRVVRTAGVEDLGPSVSESEWDEAFSWLEPANQDFAAPHIQHVLENHFRLVERLFTHANETSQTDCAAYLFGFIVITEKDWRERGVTAVHCDEDRGKWKVTRCDHIPISKLYVLEGVIERDESFDNVRGRFDDSGNDGPDNQGGPAPVGEWQFAVYCTGPAGISTYELQQRASDKIADPRRDPSYLPIEACLQFLPRTLPVESIYEDWPPTYAKFVNEPIDIATRQPKICKLHSSLFVHVRGDHSGDLPDIEIVNMEWDHNIARSEELLKQVGRESKTTTQTCDAESLLTTLEQLARTS